MPVHHGHVNVIRVRAFGFFDLFSQPRKIGGEDGGGEFDHLCVELLLHNSRFDISPH